jgi:3-methyl-2-oxobutanoate hydroxymethyltransferase
VAFPSASTSDCTPQSVHALGSCCVQGRDEAAADQVRRHVHELADAGAAMLVVELMLSRLLTQALLILVIGVGVGIGIGIGIGIRAGADCGGQVRVPHDMPGIASGELPRFVRNSMPRGRHQGGRRPPPVCRGEGRQLRR